MKKIKDILYLILLSTPTITSASSKSLNSIGNDKLNSLILITMLLPIFLVLLSYIIWYKYGKDLKYKVTKNSEIPKELSPIDISLLYNGVSTEIDVFHLLLHLANKGYIKIIEKSNNKFIIKKIKEYDGKNNLEANFLKILFRKNIVLSITEYINLISNNKSKNKKTEYTKEIKDDEIYLRFQKAKSNILSLTNINEEKEKYFENKSEKKKKVLIIMIAVILVLGTSLPVIAINKLYYLPLSVLISIFSLYTLTNFVNNADLKTNNQKIIFLTIFAFILIIIMLMPIYIENKVYIYTFLICYTSVAIILFLYKYMSKRTIYGTEQLSKIKGLKQFLNNLKDEKIDNILKDNKNYLYDVLPYSYFLNEQENVLKKLKELNINKPKWYEINGDFTIQKFSNSIKRLYEKIKEKNEEE